MAFKTKKKSKDYSSNAAALNLISYRARSEKEVREKLLDRQFLEDEIDKTVLWLKDYGYLNDEQFAIDLSSSRIRVKHWGPLKVGQELMMKGISSAIRDSVLSRYTEDLQASTAACAMEKWIRKHNLTPPLDDKNRQKAMRHLQSRGFTGQSVFKVTKNLT